MVLALVVTLLVLPALLVTVYRRQESRHIPAQAAGSRIDRVLLGRPGLVVAICVAVTAVAGFYAGRVRFDYNVLRLQSAGLDSVETEYRLLGADAESTIFAAVVTDSLAETRRVHAQLAALPTVATVHSIAEVIPEAQEEKVELVAKIREAVGDVTFAVPPFDPADAELTVRTLGALRVQASARQREAEAAGDPARVKVWPEFVAALTATREALRGMAAAELQAHVARYQTAFFRDLEAQLRMLRQQANRPMEENDLPAEIRRMLIGRSGKFLVRAFPKENIWERDPLVRFVNEVKSVAPKATGTPLGLYEFVEILLRGYRNAALWALLVITVLVFVDFRGARATALAILPLLVGMVWMLGVMGWGNLSFNPANVLTLPLLVGIGVAYGIYVVQRYREDQSAELFRKSTGRAVLLSAATTIVAFASLIYGKHRGIQSLGWVMSIGVAACLLASLALLPALLEIARRRGWKI
jgi:predicted RND superfamily exporter protein